VFSKEVLEARLMAKREIDGECWLWTGCWHKQGYGLMYVSKSPNRKEAMVHRIAAYLWRNMPLYGEQQTIPNCEHRACFNPKHLDILKNKSELFKEICRRTMPRRGEKNNFARITLEQAMDVRDALLRGEETAQEIADRVGCTRRVVYTIKYKQSWVYIWEKGFDKKYYDSIQNEKEIA